MFLIDNPYASDFLIDTIKNNQFEIIATQSAKNLINGNSLNWIEEKNAIESLLNNPKTPLYTNSENSIAWIAQNLKNTSLPKKINIFKDKFQFRELIKDLYPDFYYQKIKPEKIQSFKPEQKHYPFVIKPSVGFFSLGVHIIRNEKEWKSFQKAFDYKAWENMYPQEVLNTSDFIIEEYILGEEYAIDSYFDDEGNIVILNILHHRFSSQDDTGDRIYATSKDIILKNLSGMENFLQKIGNKVGLKNFPLHTEVRIDERGNIHPIEINPLRFGGWCTTGDLSYYAFGFNSYAYYSKKEKPDWKQIFRSKEDKIYSIVVLNNNSGIPEEQISSFDYDLLANDFENLLVMRKSDYKKYKVFGFVFAETSLENEEELNKILNSDLKKYISITQ